MQEDKIDFYKGHRQRIRERFTISQKSIPDYELLEMLLFLAFPRKDTKELSKILFKKFGNLQAIINADIEQLKDVKGIGESAIFIIRLFHEIHLRILKDNIFNKEIKLNSTEAVEKYCKASMGNLTHEQVLALFINNSSNLVAEEVINVGNVDEAKVCKNILISKATQNGAVGVILVHNHPSGSAKPSAEDKLLTLDIQRTLRQVDISLLDHIIVSKKETFSFSRNNLIR